MRSILFLLFMTVGCSPALGSANSLDISGWMNGYLAKIIE